MSETDWQQTASPETILERALMLKNIRAFFDDRGVVEVETPILSRYATTDPHLDSLSTCFLGQNRYLNTSPEYAMKRLLAYWGEPIYQISKAFRDDEQGLNHNPEFTLLEWYRPGLDMWQLMDELSELVTGLCRSSEKFLHVQSLDCLMPDEEDLFERLSYRDAFINAVGIDPHQTSSAQCLQVAKSEGIEIPQGLTVDDDVDEWLDWLLTQLVVPLFSKRGFTFLYNYPASQCALAKLESDAQQVLVARRFELYFGEIELANGFYELADAKEQLNRFQQENIKRKQAGKEPGYIDEMLIKALEHGLPDCSGVALGLDRLLMVLLNATDISKVISFSWGRA